MTFFCILTDESHLSMVISSKGQCFYLKSEQSSGLKPFTVSNALPISKLSRYSDNHTCTFKFKTQTFVRILSRELRTAFNVSKTRLESIDTENFPPVSEAASRDYYHRRIIKSGAKRGGGSKKKLTGILLNKRSLNVQ